MSARKVRKLADGSREEASFDESDNFSVDDEFSLDESVARVHKSTNRNSNVRQSLEKNHQTNYSTRSNRDFKRKRQAVISDSEEEEDTEEKEDTEKDDEDVNSESETTKNDDFTQAVAAEVASQEASGSEAEEEIPNEDELVADCGTIESITLNNFMCHEHFEIEFNPRVNFVIGKNGSK